MGIDVLGIDILGIDILGIDIVALPRVKGVSVGKIFATMLLPAASALM